MPLPLSARAFAWVAALTVLAGCSADGPAVPVAPSAAEETASPIPPTTPSPEPLAVVEGVVELTALHLEPAGQKLYPSGHPANDPPVVDEAAVHDFVGAIAERLDAHLEALQRGADSSLLDGLPTEASPTAVAAVTSALAGPEAVVASAAYTTEVAVDGSPRWAHVTVTVTHPDGSAARADLVFVPGAAGPELVAAGPSGEVQP